MAFLFSSEKSLHVTDVYHYIQPVISTPCIRMLMLLFTTGNVDEFVRKMTISRRF